MTVIIGSMLTKGTPSVDTIRFQAGLKVEVSMVQTSDEVARL